MSRLLFKTNKNESKRIGVIETYAEELVYSHLRNKTILLLIFGSVKGSAVKTNVIHIIIHSSNKIILVTSCFVEHIDVIILATRRGRQTARYFREVSCFGNNAIGSASHIFYTIFSTLFNPCDVFKVFC